VTQLHTLKVNRPVVAPEKLAFFRYGRVGQKMLVTNDAGHWHFLSDDEFSTFLRGGIEKGHPQFELLQKKGFLRDGLDVDALADQIRRKKRFVGQGPHLHIVITTLRCNQACKYCHASRTDMDRVDTDMSIETAKKVVDLAMQSTSPAVNFEFQGGEPTVNFPVIQFMVEYSREKNRQEKKLLTHSLVTNFTAMTKEKADWLIDHDVMICTSLDGPQEVHDWNRPITGGGGAPFAKVMEWMKYVNDRYVEMGRDRELWHVDALLTTTRKTLEKWKDAIDLYVSLGIRNIHLRPLNPYGFAVNTWKVVGYSTEEYLDFYAKALDYIIELNLKGTQIMEGTASTFLVKMLTADDPNFVDIRSPCGAGTGQVAYNYDGKIFTCDEARMTSAMGNDLFQIGSVASTSYAEMIQHPTVKAMAVASLQDSLPSCSTCWNKPFCGVCPMHNYVSSGDLFGQRPRSPKCKEHYTIGSLLLERLGNDSDGKIEAIFRRWTVNRPREDAHSCAT
jgi:uncharacterized protein